MNSRQSLAHATPDASDARAWTQILARYRQPSNGRGIVEIGITIVPLVGLWALIWATLDFYWVSLLLALLAAGFLVRLFMIQHDCGHGSFFRQRLANDWVGRVIGVLTLTPYRFLAAHARLASRQLRQSRPARFRRHRHADGARISGALVLGPAALSPVSASGRDVRHRAGLSVSGAPAAAVRIDAQPDGGPGSARWRPIFRSRWSSPR